MQWVAAALPLITAAACTAAFFLAGREQRTPAGPASAPPASGGRLGPEIPRFNPEGFSPSTPVEVIWRQPKLSQWKSSVAAPSSLPTRETAQPRPSFGTRFWPDEPTLALDMMRSPAPQETEFSLEPSAQPPIWLSHWASNLPVKWLSGSDTQPLQRVSGAAPLAIAASPASSDSLVQSLDALCSTSDSNYSNGRSSPRAKLDKNSLAEGSYQPPWARGDRGLPPRHRRA